MVHGNVVTGPILDRVRPVFTLVIITAQRTAEPADPRGQGVEPRGDRIQARLGRGQLFEVLTNTVKLRSQSVDRTPQFAGGSPQIVEPLAEVIEPLPEIRTGQQDQIAGAVSQPRMQWRAPGQKLGHSASALLSVSDARMRVKH